MRCLECGNKAKKDCRYYLCRSCCKGHGFRCETHVRSTWVPVSTRRLPKNTAAAMAASTREQPQLHLPSSSGLGEGKFPTEVGGAATFIRVRVTSSSKGNAVVNHYAYETSVNIGGHIFKGVLYNHGRLDDMVINSQQINIDGEDQQNTTVNIRSDILIPVNNSMASPFVTPSNYTSHF